MLVDEANPDLTPASGASPWSQNPRTLLIIAAAAFALLGLVALASVIDLPTSETASDVASQPADRDGFDSEGRVDLGDGGALDIRPIPGCPDGFSIGEDIYVVPDPEACGFRPVAPGERGLDPNGKIVLVPDIDGNVGGIRIGPNGEVELLPPGVLGPNDFAIGQSPDGSFGLIRPDGSRVEIAPGDDGLSLRDPQREGSEFLSPPPAAGEPEPAEPELAQPRPNTDSTDGGEPDGSFLGPALIILLALVVIGFLIMALRKADWRKDDHDVDDEGSVQDTLVDYSSEIGALDRLLWEIDQEPDPRTAIRRVYGALETGLDNPALARRRSETPGIYLHRVLGRFTELDLPLRELTELFEQARFSEHEITQEMRDRAVTILVAVRGHYAHAGMVPA
mgnify:CR=1 FL=1